MNESASRDIELVRQLAPQWYASRRWAEELLCRGFGLTDPSDILRDRNKNPNRIVPGTNWRVQVHGIGVNIDRGIACGGIDFDFDKPDPDLWRLKRFAEKQLNVGNIPIADYFNLINEEDRFDAAFRAAFQAPG